MGMEEVGQTVSKLHERVNQHDVEFAKLSTAVSVLAENTSETKNAVLGIYRTMEAINKSFQKMEIREERALLQAQNINDHLVSAHKRIDAALAAQEKAYELLNTRLDTQKQEMDAKFDLLNVYFLATKYPKFSLLILALAVAILIKETRDKLVGVFV